MSKKNTLQAMLDRVKNTNQTTINSDKNSDKSSKKTSLSSRNGTKLIGGHFSPEVSAQLRIIAAEEDSTIQNLLGEAIDDLFIKKGRSRIVRL